MSGPKIIVALDFDNSDAAIMLAKRLDPRWCRVKVGLELFVSAGPGIVEKLSLLGFDVFLDLKFHDIPNTVAKSCKAAAATGAWMINIHSLGGERMMAAAREAVDSCSHKPRLIAVTILTSHADEELVRIGLSEKSSDAVLRLATMARQNGIDGVVCSPHEATLIRQQLGNDFLLVTPGVRPADAAVGDQRRVMTPEQALKAGASYLVIGRPITSHHDPAARAKEIAMTCQSFS